MATTTAASAIRGVGSSLLLVLLLCCDVMVTAFVATHWRARGRDIYQGKGAGDKLPFRSRPVHRHPRTMEMDLASLFFSFGQKNKQKAAEQGTEVADRLSAELFSMLTDEGARPDEAAVMSKIEELEAAPGVTFNKDYLYDGPWRVLWKTNTEWQRYFDPLNGLADNKSYQWYKEGGSVTNIAQALGENVYVTVDGQGVPASESTELPYEVNVEVSRAWLHAFGGKVPLNFIKGKGTTFVVYNDAKLRVFRSDTGGVVVQTKADEFVPV